MRTMDIQVGMNTLHALDGWRLEWDLDRVPAMIIAYNAEGVQKWCLSGELNYRRLKREKDAFLGDHGPEQLRLF
jgi:hypothetical protein